MSREIVLIQTADLYKNYSFTANTPPFRPEPGFMAFLMSRGILPLNYQHHF
ncbi:hypothetical protein FLA_0948 [Filimonas lacunae]|nr:hypothetical protein FLA_0948 [Filimonas lacunae]